MSSEHFWMFLTDPYLFVICQLWVITFYPCLHFPAVWSRGIKTGLTRPLWLSVSSSQLSVIQIVPVILKVTMAEGWGPASPPHHRARSELRITFSFQSDINVLEECFRRILLLPGSWWACCCEWAIERESLFQGSSLASRINHLWPIKQKSRHDNSHWTSAGLYDQTIIYIPVIQVPLEIHRNYGGVKFTATFSLQGSKFLLTSRHNLPDWLKRSMRGFNKGR